MIPLYSLDRNERIGPNHIHRNLWPNCSNYWRLLWTLLFFWLLLHLSSHSTAKKKVCFQCIVSTDQLKQIINQAPKVLYLLEAELDTLSDISNPSGKTGL